MWNRLDSPRDMLGQMLGPCLFPMYMDKQTALQAILEDLLATTGHVFLIRIEQVIGVLSKSLLPPLTARGSMLPRI